jgi:hypothetical protein
MFHFISERSDRRICNYLSFNVASPVRYCYECFLLVEAEYE